MEGISTQIFEDSSDFQHIVYQGSSEEPELSDPIYFEERKGILLYEGQYATI